MAFRGQCGSVDFSISSPTNCQFHSANLSGLDAFVFFLIYKVVLLIMVSEQVFIGNSPVKCTLQKINNLFVFPKPLAVEICINQLLIGKTLKQLLKYSPAKTPSVDNLHNETKGGCMQINRIQWTLTLGGEKQVADLVF